MFGYIILSVLLITRQVVSQADDEDQKTQEWLKAQNNQTNVDDILKWVSTYIPNANNAKKPTINLDPTNVVIKNASLHQPAEATNKFDDKNDSQEMDEKPCLTEDGRSGVCVLYYQCDPSTRKVIGEGTSVIDERFGEVCSSYLYVCCNLNDRQDSAAEQEPPPKTAEDEPPHSPMADSWPNKVKPTECGWNNPDLFVFQPPTQEVADRGYYANYGDFPWMVALLKKSGTSVWVQNDYIGGGSLIHPSVVMTAYHKLVRTTPEEVKCRAGEWDTQTVNEQYRVQERDAERFVSHKDFYLTSVYNDIALVFLKTPFDMAKAPHIGTACLSRELPDPGTLCFTMGWGKDVRSDDYVNILKKIRLPLVEHEQCQEMLHKKTRFKHIPKFLLHESLTCAGGEEYVDACQGDGGSSLVCPIGNRGGKTRYAAVGMVAYGLDCGKKDVPGVYVNVPHLYDWVDEQMRAAGLPTDTYSF